MWQRVGVSSVQRSVDDATRHEQGVTGDGAECNLTFRVSLTLPTSRHCETLLTPDTSNWRSVDLMRQHQMSRSCHLTLSL